MEQTHTHARGQLAHDAGPLNEAAAAGDPDAALEVAYRYLQARGIPRDLNRAREFFIRAGDLGQRQAQRIAISLLANGSTGGRDWARALARLDALRHAGDEFAERQLSLLDAMDLTDEGDPRMVGEGETLSMRPRVSLFPRLFTEAECRYVSDAASAAYRPATVRHVSGAMGPRVVQQIRTCDVAAFPWTAEDAVIHALNRRIAAAARMPVAFGEPLQVLRYKSGQEFKPHRDCTGDTANQRVLTMLVYLNDAYTGGETLFLDTGLKVRGGPGDGLLFRNADEDGTPDPSSLHAGLPVQSGEKIVASRWIRQKRFGPPV